MKTRNNAKAIKIAMIRSDISVADLAKKIDRRVTTISRWRKHGCNSISAMQDIAKACGIRLDELLAMGEEG